MSHSSILGGERAPQRSPGNDVDRLGPSDSSDSGSDVQGEQPMATSPDNPGEWGATPTDAGSDSDSLGTGERSSAAGTPPRDGADIMPDRITGGIGEAPDAASDEELDSALDQLVDEDDSPTASTEASPSRSDRDR